jgi:hypothetical protein
MLKRVVASLVTSVGLLGMNASAALARPAIGFRHHETFYPSTCDIGINGQTFTCEYAVIGAFNNGSANFKLCSSRDCLILILTRAQLANLANGRNFSVRQIAWQSGNRITRQWNASMECGSRSQAVGCTGRLTNGSRVAIYLE